MMRSLKIIILLYIQECLNFKYYFPFFQGLHKLNKKNNLQEIKMNYIELDNITIPIQYDIKSKKFSAKLYLKSYEINNK